MTKFACCLVFVLTVCYAHARPRDANCYETAGLENLRLDGLVSFLEEAKSDPKFELFLQCSYKKQMLYLDDGKLDFDAMKHALKRYHGSFYDDAIEFCRSTKQTENRGKNAVKVAKCLHRFTKAEEKEE